MGITVTDTLSLNNGLTAANCYVSFGAHTLAITKTSSDSYNVACAANIWVNQTARDAGTQPIQGLSISIVVTKLDLDSNIYADLYTELKKNYVTTSDVL